MPMLERNIFAINYNWLYCGPGPYFVICFLTSWVTVKMPLVYSWNVAIRISKLFKHSGVPTSPPL